VIPGNNILLLAPHTDDAELGCGGTIARLLEEGKQVYSVAFSTCEESLPVGLPSDTLKKEFISAMTIMGVPMDNLFIYDFPVRRLSYFRQKVLDIIISLRRQINPDLIFIPSGNDLHQDHQVVHSEGLRAFKDLSVFGYELPWNHIHFSAQSFIPLDHRHIQTKWEALKCYGSQLSLDRPYFSKQFVEGLAKVRGIQVKVEWAEAFEVLRLNCS